MISPVGGDVILKLSEMLRYSVDSTKQDLVVISKEVEAIERYISLQKTRFENNVFINFNPEGDLEKHKIPPLILLSIVENAFKYGILNDENKYIGVIFKVINKELYFECTNTIRQDFKDKETNAVGLGNIRRRLEIVYKDKFELTHFVNDDKFIVLLRIFY